MQQTQLSLFGEDLDKWCSDDWQTPLWLAEKIAALRQPEEKVVIDAGAGVGNITRFLTDGEIYAVEKNRGRVVRGEAIALHAKWVCTDYLEFNQPADLIVGNPPFSIAPSFVDHSLSLLRPNGRILFLLPLDWNCTKKAAKQWKQLEAIIHHEYRIEGRVAYLDGNGVSQSGRQVCDAVFDIRKVGRSGVSYI